MTDEKQNTKPVNEIQKAIAIKYESEDVPRIVAKGEGNIAEKIVTIAKEHDIVLYQDKELIKILSKLDLEEEIPNNLFEAVAAVLAFVYNMNGKAKDLPGME